MSKMPNKKEDISTGKRWCSVPGCKYKPGISFHKFPLDKILKQKWKEALKINKVITPYVLVCTAHFEKKDYFRSKLK